MADTTQIITLYTELANNPQKDFGWDKGLENAKAHRYKQEWIEKLPSEVWEYCAAVGNPFSLGEIQEGESVVDLGCGAGVDLLVSALKVGDKGQAIGIDITPKMVEKAKYHAELAGLTNVIVKESSFDDTGLEENSIDVVISNGAINLTACKESVFAEIHRILKPNGRLMFADMIDITKSSSECCSEQATACCSSEQEDWANCVAGTLRKDELINIMKQAGFENIEFKGLTHYTTAETTQGALFRAIKKPLDEVRKDYWNNFFNTRDYTQVLWHQTHPSRSLEQIQQYASKDDPIIDVGCGASLLVDNLIAEAYKNISLLDAAAEPLETVKKRLGENAEIPTFNCSDILNFKPKQKFKVWHDRAMFHFLLNPSDRKKYFEALKESLLPDGIAIINTFAINGETECAGLKTAQYSSDIIKNELPKGLSLVKSEEFIHITPKNTEQKYCAFFIKSDI
ncbi:methyltransferase domain-containing protein [Sulfurimonas marina]|uniref:Methyltransferase domain-containing protein n=1 Tax=Sulfurimonas marina TaxID=2590551 RepID=A0A7M1AWJ4_9BACT|nr:methyltransferase domain-containing protein [Sulfurimonas marina]QOP41841.1 methyltransferase domain-containing protein [Sulfurimonas marina]